MSRNPTADQITALFDRIRKLTKPPAPKCPVPLDLLEQRTLALAKRARTPGPDVDGYPTATIGDGPRGNAELTSVEAAANRGFPRDDGTPPRPERDLVADDAENAYGYLVDAVNALGALATRLDHADKVASTLSRAEAGGSGQCKACERDVSGAAEDRIKSGYCERCYKAWCRADRPDRTEWERDRRAYLNAPIGS